MFRSKLVNLEGFLLYLNKIINKIAEGLISLAIKCVSHTWSRLNIFSDKWLNHTKMKCIKEVSIIFHLNRRILEKNNLIQNETALCIKNLKYTFHLLLSAVSEFHASLRFHWPLIVKTFHHMHFTATSWNSGNKF